MKKNHLFSLFVLILFVFINCALYAEINVNSVAVSKSSYDQKDIAIYKNIGIIVAVIICSLLSLYDHKRTLQNPKLSEDRKAFENCASIFVLICILVLLLLINSYPFKSSSFRHPWREKVCYSNIRILQDAVEMYNEEQKIPIKSIDININDLDVLVKYADFFEYYEKFVKKDPSNKESIVPQCPSDSKNHYISLEDLTEGGAISCGDDPIGYDGFRNKKNEYFTTHGTQTGTELRCN